MTIYGGLGESALRYARACGQHDTRDMGSVQAVLAARVELVTGLLSAGWTPPAGLTAALEQDTAVMRLSPGDLENWPAPDPPAGTAAGTSAPRTSELTVSVLPVKRLTDRSKS